MAGQGYLTKAALGKETTWGTGVAVDEVLPFTNESLTKGIERAENEYLDRTVGKSISKTTFRNVAGDIECEAVYDVIAGAIKGVDSLFLGALGAANYDAVGGRSEFSVANSIPTSFTVAFNKVVSVWESLGVKINTLKIAGKVSGGGKVTITASVLASNLLRSGTTNSATSINNLVPTNRPVLVTLDDAIVRMDILGAALTSADQVNISEFEFEFNNNLSDDTYATPDTSTHTDSGGPLEHLRNDWPSAKLKLTFPRYEANTVFTYLDSNNEVQVDIKFSNGSNELNLYLPRLVVTTPEAQVSDSSIMPLTVEFDALVNGSTNTNMTFVSTNPITGLCGIETKNARTTTP